MNNAIKEPLQKCALERIASLRPHSNLAYRSDMSAVFIAGRLALHLNITIFQRFLRLFYSRKALASLLMLGLWLVATSLQAADLTSRVDRNRINVNETLTLTLEYNERVDTDSLDLSGLQQDFDLLAVRPQSSSSVSIVNGRYSQVATTIWTITLAPKRQGALIIPSFNLQGDVSNAIRVDVTDAQTARPQDTPMRVSLEVDLDRAYVGQQILVNVELLAQSQVGNLSGSELRLDNVHLEMLDQRSYRRVENGISWQVVEWKYALIPEQQGTLSIPPQMFTGAISQANAWDPFNQRGRRISARSHTVEVEILPPPDTQGMPWFPAKNVAINASWSGDVTQMRVGEPLTRTVEISAQGQRASVIPPLPENSSLTYKSYSDQPQLDNQLNAQGIQGIRRESRAIVPSAEGIIELPEERVIWWNTSTQDWQEAILPAETLSVLPAIQDTSFAPPGAPVFLPEEATGTEVMQVTKTAWYWPWITGLLALLVLLQGWLLFNQRKIPESTEQNSTASVSEKSAWKHLRKTFKRAQTEEIRQEILAWARMAFPENRVTLGFLAAKGNETLKNQLARLDQSLYKGDTEVDVKALETSLAELRTSITKEPADIKSLQPLYPT